MNWKISIASLCSMALLMACQTSQPTNYMQLDKYLNSFIGQDSQKIQQQIDFKSLGYQANPTPQLTDSTLIYIILRPVNIPVTVTPTVGVNAAGVAVIRNDTSSSPTDLKKRCT